MKVRHANILLLGLLVLTGAVARWQTWTGSRACPRCLCVQQIQVTTWRLLGFRSDTVEVQVERSSEFVQAFPEYTCEHVWGMYSGAVSFAVGSPFLVAVPREEYGTASKLPGQYSTNSVFRHQLHVLLDAGTVTRQEVVVMAASHCIDGGLCLLRGSTNESHRALLHLFKE